MCSTPNFCGDVSAETLRVTTLGKLRKGSSVNLERALRLSDRLGGHWVTGHIDQTCCLSEIAQQQDFAQLHFSGVAAEHLPAIMKKGSVTVHGGKPDC